MAKLDYYFSKSKRTMVPINRWDLLALTLILSLLFLVAYGTKEMAVPFSVGETLPISLDPWWLPYYALRSVLRMLFALICSLLFTFIFGTWAAKSKRAERIIIPAIDILQSVPILGFLSISVVLFIKLFPNSLLGPECAAIFVIFTSQVWNMTLSLYQSIKTVPADLIEAAHMYHLSPWQQFWRIEVPFAMPALLWNTMMSMSASWFFVVASEAISVAHQDIALPGIGSYIALAIDNTNGFAMLYAVITMFFVILLYDQLLFRPLVLWAEKFKTDSSAPEMASRAWMTSLLQRTQALKYISSLFAPLLSYFVNLPLFPRRQLFEEAQPSQRQRLGDALWNALVWLLIILCGVFLIRYIFASISLAELMKVLGLGLVTALRVAATIIFCTLLWVPLGVWIGLRPRLAAILQPTMQFLAAFPANLLFPVVVFFIVKYGLNVQIWTTPLMILGTQWYVAFNIIAGTLAIPKDLHLAIDNFGVKGWQRWRKFIIPAIFPYYVTGAITAVGGAWNVSIVTEVVNWGNQTLAATGLGAYITEATTAGNFPQLALGITVMCLYVLVINRLLWRPLYLMAERRFRIE